MGLTKILSTDYIGPSIARHLSYFSTRDQSADLDLACGSKAMIQENQQALQSRDCRDESSKILFNGAKGNCRFFEVCSRLFPWGSKDFSQKRWPE